MQGDEPAGQELGVGRVLQKLANIHGSVIAGDSDDLA